MIDPNRTKVISKLSKNAMYLLLGKINFIRRFIPSFFEIVKPLQGIIKKYIVFKWGENEKESFKNIKEVIIGAPTL